MAGCVAVTNVSICTFAVRTQARAVQADKVTFEKLLLRWIVCDHSQRLADLQRSETAPGARQCALIRQCQSPRLAKVVEGRGVRGSRFQAVVNGLGSRLRDECIRLEVPGGESRAAVIAGLPTIGINRIGRHV